MAIYKKNLNKQTLIRMTEKQDRFCETMARTYGISKSDYIRKLIDKQITINLYSKGETIR